MLVQRRPAGCRLITQHQHGLVAGVLAGAWRGAPRPTGLPPVTMLAAALHDVVWREEDRSPRFDPERNLPHDFATLPAYVKRQMLERGLEALDAVEPRVADLVRAHHMALLEGRAPPDDEAKWVAFLDALALRICLTPPDAERSGVPGWLLGAAPMAPGGDRLDLTWRTPSLVTLSPFPFPGQELVLHVPYRDLPLRTFPDAGSLERAWIATPPAIWTIRLLSA